jgi:uncharacterized membrane protein YkvA (DUF1232 family)
LKKSGLPTDLRQTAGLVGGLFQQARLVWRLLRDGRVPSVVKLIPLAGLFYLLSPVDLIPDVLIPGLGQLDDLAILLLALKAFVDLAPPGVVREHLDAVLGKKGGAQPRAQASSGVLYIDAPYQVLDRD